MKKRSRRARLRICLQVLISVLLLVFFYSVGLPLYFIVFIGLFIVLMIFLKGKLYRSLEKFMNKRLPFPSKLKPWLKKLIIVVVFILVYMFLKQIIFFVLEQFGIDVQQIIEGSVNRSLGG